jgi:hypothetical protein
MKIQFCKNSLVNISFAWNKQFEHKGETHISGNEWIIELFPVSCMDSLRSWFHVGHNLGYDCIYEEWGFSNITNVMRIFGDPNVPVEAHPWFVKETNDSLNRLDSDGIT